MRETLMTAFVAVAFMLVVPVRASAADGEAVFKKSCGICHTVEAGKNRIGPSLGGVVGRKAGTAPGYNYSEANKNSGLVWTADILDKYLLDPKTVVPGTKMAFQGLKDADDRAAVIGYLKAN